MYHSIRAQSQVCRMNAKNPVANIVSIAVIAVAAACLLPESAFARALPDFTELVESNRTAVVNISTTQRRTAPSNRPRLPKGFEIPDLPDDSPFQEFLPAILRRRRDGRIRHPVPRFRIHHLF